MTGPRPGWDQWVQESLREHDSRKWEDQSLRDFYERQFAQSRPAADATGTPDINQLLRRRRRMPRMGEQMDRDTGTVERLLEEEFARGRGPR